ncbi:TPA: MFS transporter [Legionella pneumophila]|uniref:MFS transporter n=1 Tax=Legionella pneumophila TaxID=446 RepID=A0A2S6EYV4_LEGPN|nr:MFS transporter [Legionella pneumophila]APF02902.1 2-acyl-glycerophospho-ethanolamine acyltransferase [Legionella pneumophila subsp. fraseri]APF05932.1 MFS transporter [Legionella pneumophila subsp. fraseri]AUB68392.1 MFS transporter [Legionella pneumophila]AUB71365.1 MFS transporter [Legionella pneumophila]KXB24110.1 2-acyl-glycerophospho-ethanolamine acyltransferase [Legionella pneumophila]
MAAGFIGLLKQRKFFPLFLTQFFGAFNDNAYKLAMLTMISYHLSHTQEQSEYYQAIAGALFIMPFFIFSATSGQLADKYDKALLTRLVKVLEVLLMIIGGIGLYSGSIFLMMCTLTGMGAHSAFFGPIKYAILPDHLPRKNLLAATGLIEASTFMAILLGTTLGTLTVGGKGATPYIAIIMTLSAAFSGLVSSLFIPPAPSALPELKVDFNLWRSTVKMLKEAKKEYGIFLSILTISWFWLIGAVMLTKLPDYTHYVLGASAHVFALFLALFSIGIALGSITINWLLKGQVNLSAVPMAMLAFTLFAFDLYWSSPADHDLKTPLFNLLNFFTSFTHWRIAFDLFMLAFCAGLFVVPLYTYLQIISAVENRARTIAANNIYNALFMVMGTLLVMLLLFFNFSIPQVFLILCILNLLAALFLFLGLKTLRRSSEEMA